MKTVILPRRRLAFVSSISAAALVGVLPGHAASVIFSINADGASEVTNAGVPNQGDLDGSAIGTLTLDDGDGTGTTGSATFNITMSNIDITTLSGHHVHQAPPTTNGGIVLNFGDPDTIRTGSLLSGTITGLPAATITAVFADPAAFYYNLHNSSFPGGAVRDQLAPVPEPGAALLGGFGLLGATLRRRRA